MHGCAFSMWYWTAQLSQNTLIFPTALICAFSGTWSLGTKDAEANFVGVQEKSTHDVFPTEQQPLNTDLFQCHIDFGSLSQSLCCPPPLIVLLAKHEQRRKNSPKWDPGLPAAPVSGKSFKLLWCDALTGETLCQKHSASQSSACANSSMTLRN